MFTDKKKYGSKCVKIDEQNQAIDFIKIYF